MLFNELKCGIVRLTVLRAKVYTSRGSYQYSFSSKLLFPFRLLFLLSILFLTYHRINICSLVLHICRLAGEGWSLCFFKCISQTIQLLKSILQTRKQIFHLCNIPLLLFATDVSYKERIWKFSNFTETDSNFCVLKFHIRSAMTKLVEKVD